jgi:prenyltransferase beta subunit
MKANTIKLMINSFANGHLELVKDFHRQYGDNLFDHIPHLGSRGTHHRLIFYAFKGNHKEVIEYYLKQNCVKPLSESEIYAISKNVAKPGKFIEFIENRSELYKTFLPLERCIEVIKSNITQSYDLQLIDEYLERYPEDFNSILDKCSSSARGIQLRRHLQLKQLINE